MEQTKNFLEILHSRLAEGEVVELRSWLPGSKKQPKTFFSADFDELTNWLLENYQERETFVGVNPRRDARGKTEDVSRAYWLWADLDKDKMRKGGAALVNWINSHFILPPTMLVSSHGDDGGIHAYWAIEPTTDLDKTVELNDAICKMLGSDPVSDAPRILRPVGTLNHKYTPPIPVKLVVYNENALYSIEDVEAALALPSKFVKMVNTGDNAGYTSRSERDYAVIGALIRAGYSDELIRGVFNYYKVGDKYKEEPDPEHYLSFSLEKMRGKEQPVGQNRWGIVEKNQCYYRVTQDGLVQLSTFVFEPVVLLEGDLRHGEEDTLLGVMVSSGVRTPDVPLGKKAFTDNTGMAKALLKASWQWLGKDTDVKKLLPYLLDKLKDNNNGTAPTKVKTAVLGRHEDMFVLDGQVIDKNGLINPDDAPIVWLPSGKELPSIKFTPAPRERFKAELADFVEVAFGINNYDVVLLMLGFLVASFYKPILNERGVHLPVLNIFGTRGAGKTTLVTDLLQRLSGYVNARTYDSNTTRFVMLSLLGCSNAIPISFSEFRSASMRDADQLPGYVRLAYDSGHDSRGRSDQSMVDYALSAPFTIDGEDALSDPACLERSIQLNLRPETIKEGTIAYSNMRRLQQVDLNCIGYELVRYTLCHDIDFDASYEHIRELYSSNLPDRVRRNFAVVLAGLDVFTQFLADNGFELEGIDEHELLDAALQNVVNFDTGRTSLPIDDFVTDLILCVEHTDGYKPFVYKYDPDTFVLHFNFTSAYSWWAKQKRSEGKSILDKTAIKRQLQERTSTEEILKVGDYLMPAHNLAVDGTTKYMIGVSLPQAVRAGLDVPDRITRIKPKIIRALEKAEKEEAENKQ